MKPLTLAVILAVACAATVLLKDRDEAPTRTVATTTSPAEVVALAVREDKTTFTLVSDEGKPVAIAEETLSEDTPQTVRFAHGFELPQAAKIGRVPDPQNRGFHLVVARLN